MSTAQTNEELAVMIQQGRTEAYAQLWEQVKRFMCHRARLYFSHYGEQCAASGVELDDLYQAAFLALADAVQAFDATKGFTFLTLAGYPLKTRFRELLGIRTQRKDPINRQRSSLDATVPGTDDLLIGDTVPDEAAQLEYEGATDRIYNEQLHNALDRALDTLDERQEAVLRQRYYENKPLRRVADNMDVGAERIRQIEAKALRTLRRGKCVRILADYRDETMKRCAWHGTGWSAFLNTGASSVERAVEYAYSLKFDDDNVDIC